MAGVKWSDAEEAIIREHAARGDRAVLNALHAAGYTKRSVAAARLKRANMGIMGASSTLSVPTLTRIVSEHPERIVYAPEETDEEPFEDLLERAKLDTERDTRKAYARRFCIARIVTDRPIGITLKSDQHLTMHGPCDVGRAFSDAEIVQQTQGLYCLLGGDGVDNHIKHTAAMVSKASRPTDEYRLYDGYLRTLGHKILAMISGNHDDFTRDASGIDMVGILAARHRLHYAPDEVVMTVQLVPDAKATEGQEYTIKMRHQYRYNSSLNVGHSVKRMYDMGGDVFDIGVIAHNHEAHLETFERHGQTRWALRPGSYQVESAWSRRIGFGQSYPTCPGVVLWPGERRIEGFHDLRGLVEKLGEARRLAAR